MCLSSGCLRGTYFSTSTAAIGDLESGTDVCIPCHHLCVVCIGPGTRLDNCSKCRYATRVSEQCVRSCNATSGEETWVARCLCWHAAIDLEQSIILGTPYNNKFSSSQFSLGHS